MRREDNETQDLSLPCRLAALALVSVTLISACGDSEPSSGPTGTSPPPTVGVVPPTGNSLPGPRPPLPGPRPYTLYESGPVRPLALAADGDSLFLVNTPDGRLEILDVGPLGLTPSTSISVGLEPVAVAEAPDGTVWVVNHVSDSVSIVDVTATPARVIRTLLVGDEPRDIVFGGTGMARAFITTAHRGQNSPVDPQLSSRSVGRADVWVFDSSDLGASAGGEPETIITLFGDTPRALAVTPDGTTVYAAVFRSGNQTTTVGPQGLAKARPRSSADGVPQPDSGVILRFEGVNWVDETNTAFNNLVPFTLPDYDVFQIDADAATPTDIDQFSGVGTTLFNMAVNPVTGEIYVSNIAARNHVRFAGENSRGSDSVQGHLADNRITIISSGNVAPRRINPHIDFDLAVGTAAERAVSLSMLLDMAVTADGSTLYATAFGSSRLGVFDTADLAAENVSTDATRNIEITGGGPSGVVLDEARGRAYVATRFDMGVSVVDLATRTETAHLLLFSPEPESVTAGRPFLYDARISSSRGNDSCGTCHLFGDNDALAWDLGDPDARTSPIPNTFIPISPAAQPYVFHPMKGPMTTQSMRGLTNHGPMHWRGDRTGAARTAGQTLEEAAFIEFNEAFIGLMGRESEISSANMQAFADFAMQIVYPPNPIRPLDNSLTALQQQGLDIYNSGVVRIQTGLLEVCARCHPIDPARGIFGTRGLLSNNSQPGEQNVKIPHFRDFYQKIGMFGFGFGTAPATGPQVRGFGYNHNGATSSNFIIADLGQPGPELTALRAFLFAFPTESAPVLGQQITLDDGDDGSASARLDLLLARAVVTNPVPECDLVAHGVVAGVARGWAFDRTDGEFHPDRGADAALTPVALRSIAAAPGQPITFTCAPWGSGERIGIDRDLDGVLNGD
jgi:YVTN family beta-propeller protein